MLISMFFTSQSASELTTLRENPSLNPIAQRQNISNQNLVVIAAPRVATSRTIEARMNGDLRLKACVKGTLKNAPIPMNSVGAMSSASVVKGFAC